VFSKGFLRASVSPWWVLLSLTPSTTGSRRHGVFSINFLRVSVTPWWVLLLLLAPAAQAQFITFRDITAHAGIHFTHNSGAFGKKYLPETMGPGCAFIDYDND